MVSNMTRDCEVDIVILPEGEGRKKIYSVYAIQVPNVVTQAKTIEEAKRRLREALKLYFEDYSSEEKKKTICQEAPLISRIFL